MNLIGLATFLGSISYSINHSSMNLFDQLAIVICDSDLKDKASSEKELVYVNINWSSIIEVVGMRYGFIQLILFLYGVFLNTNDLYSEGIVSLF